MSGELINVVIAGLGGQGVITASDILAQTALRAGLDVKKSEIKGMSQRGGSVTSDVRFGDVVLSPMVPSGEADFLLVLEPTEVEPNRHYLARHGKLITPAAVNDDQLPNRKSVNVALLGALSAHLPLAEDLWLECLHEGFRPEFFEASRHAFLIGRVGQTASPTP